jgi:hypothetical protein
MLEHATLDMTFSRAIIAYEPKWIELCEDAYRV